MDRASGRVSLRPTLDLAGREDLETEAMRAYAHRAVDWMIDYLTRLQEPDSGPIFPTEAHRDIFDEFTGGLSEEGASPERVFQEFQETVVPHSTALQHPGNLAYIPNSSGIVGIVADLLASTLNQNCAIVRGGPSAAAVEAQVVQWLQALIGYPETGGGILTSGGSLANLMGLALARHRAQREGASQAQLVFYFSKETHSSMQRALRFLGVPESAVRYLELDDAFRIRPEALEGAISEDRQTGKTPAALVATAGTIGSGAVDPLDELATICEREGVWFHIDGAYGALAAAAPSCAWMRSGLARADSLSLDPHKWLFVPLDASCLLVRDLPSMRRFFTVVPEYLKVIASEQEGDIHQPMEHTIELSRRFRALKLWMTLKTYGAGAVRKRIDEHLMLARLFGDWVSHSQQFELSAQVVTSTVCFRFVPRGITSEEELDRLNEDFMHALNLRTGLFVSRNRLNGRFTLRACVTHLRTTEEDLRRLWNVCGEIAQTLPSSR